jgi:hypothetical protein
MQKKKAPKKKISSQAVTIDTPDRGLSSKNSRHHPSSGFSHSPAESFRDDRSVNPNVRYVPDENNRDEMRVRSRSGDSRGDLKHDDRSIHDLVSEVLSRHPDIDVSQVESKVKHGVVTLKGEVETRRLKRLIEDVVFGLPGVHDVKNAIDVRREDPDRKRIARSLS